MIVPGSVNPLLMSGGTACGVPLVTDPSYKISRSLRFRSAATPRLKTTRSAVVTDTNSVAKTYSFWLKRGGMKSGETLFQQYAAAGYGGIIYFDATGHLNIQVQSAGFYIVNVLTAMQFMDPSAWYHIVISVNYANATATDRIRIYVNGTRITCSTYAVSASTNTWLSDFSIAPTIWNIGANDFTAVYADYYLADVRVVDGPALDASAFGELNSDTGVWQAKAYTGAYGVNGFWLKFEDTAQIGKDSSGNTHHFTPTGIDVAAPGTQATYDSMKDSPTAYDDGTPNPPGNYCTLNPAVLGGSVLTNSNLTSAGAVVEPTMKPETGTWYFEVNGVAQLWTPPAAFPAMAGAYNFGQHPFVNVPTGMVLTAQNLPYCEPFLKPDGTAANNKTVTLAAGQFMYLGYVPTVATGVTWGTQLTKYANGVKAITAGTYTITNSGERLKTGIAQGNP